ncbi:MAG: FMN-binding protein [Proteobacteria bacterium]|nr:FMN-binding protein [Pseudomonadota bacterium]
MGSKTRWTWLPLATVAAAAPAHAMVYLSVEQAQRLMFGAAALEPLPLALGADDVAAVEHASGTRYRTGALRGWKAADGYLYVDQVVGKHDLITYAVALTAAGTVRQVEILEYREAYGGEVRGAAWRGQFVGRKFGDPVATGRDIQNISGATLSCQHLADGIRRLLAVHALVVAPR